MTFPFLLQAKKLELKKDSRTIYILEKKGWELGKELFGMPFVYFSPRANGQRSNISFTDTGANLELESKALSLSSKDYESNKIQWSKKVQAFDLNFIPYKMMTNKFGHKVHQIGLSYKHQDRIYIEKSNYIECRGKIIFVKSLRLKENESHEKDFSELIENLDCAGV